MEKLMLSEIARALHTFATAEAEITEISTDTRNMPVGCLFVAIRGDKFDGHDFIPKAIESGAAAVLSEERIVTKDCPCIVVRDTRKAYLELAGYYRSKFHPALIAVTGSVGKTTTKEMLALVLSQKHKCLKTQGNLNNEIGLSKTLFNLDSSYNMAVIEMGMSHAGEISRLSMAADPTVGIITNIGFSHIENFENQEGILYAKLEILDGMTPDSPMVVNGDDPNLRRLLNIVPPRPLIMYGIDNEKCDCRAFNIEERDGWTYFDMKFDHRKAKVKIPCVGRHNVLNALPSFIVGWLASMTMDEVALALEKYHPDAMRQNIVEKDGVTVIIDCYNASPDSMKASLNVLSNYKADGEKIAVLGDMLELGDESVRLHTLVGDYVRDAKIDFLYCYGHDSEYIIKNSNTAAGFFEKDAKDLLVNTIKTHKKKGDVILFKASRGMKLEEIIEKVFDGEVK